MTAGSLMGVYGDAEVERWLREAFAAAGKKLDMGKSCVRFKRLDALPLEVIGEVIGKVPPQALIAAHDAAHGKAGKAARPASRKAAATAPARAARKRTPRP